MSDTPGAIRRSIATLQIRQSAGSQDSCPSECSIGRSIDGDGPSDVAGPKSFNFSNCGLPHLKNAMTANVLCSIAAIHAS